MQVVPLSWGLDRIDEHDRPLGHRFTYTSDGSGVNLYVIDSGVAANRITPAVANLGFGGGASTTRDTAVTGLINAGVATVVAAQYLKTAPSATPATVKSYIVNNATSGHLTSIGTGSPNKLLFAPPGGVETDHFPVPQYASSCASRTCTFTNQSTDDFGISLCYWNWGHDFQLTESCATSVVHTFPYAGSFTVRLAITDDGLQTAYIEKVVTVN